LPEGGKNSLRRHKTNGVRRPSPTALGFWG
jgi:hypothetical protein